MGQTGRTMPRVLDASGCRCLPQPSTRDQCSGRTPAFFVNDPNGQVVCSAGAANTVNFF